MYSIPSNFSVANSVAVESRNSKQWLTELVSKPSFNSPHGSSCPYRLNNMTVSML